MALSVAPLVLTDPFLPIQTVGSLSKAAWSPPVPALADYYMPPYYQLLCAFLYFTIATITLVTSAFGLAPALPCETLFSSFFSLFLCLSSSCKLSFKGLYVTLPDCPHQHPQLVLGP